MGWGADMDKSKIEWCDSTFNPWMGCTKVSAGCTNCYAEALMDKRYGKVQWGPTGTRVRTSAALWRQPLLWQKQADSFMECPACGWRGVAQSLVCLMCGENGVGLKPARRRVFCASLADVFEDNPQLTRWRADLFEHIVYTPSLDWLLLTKRPENILPMATQVVEDCLLSGRPKTAVAVGRWLRHGAEYLPNVLSGTTVENQATADDRIPELLKVPGRHFLSCEPLLGPVNLDRYFGLLPGKQWAECLCDVIDPADRPCLTCEARQGLGAASGIHWVIAGGESGSEARPMHPAWARSLRDQCVSAGVPFHFKQWGEHYPMGQRQLTGRAQNYPTSMTVSTISWDGGRVDFWRVGKKAAGRLLDGVEWSQFPGGR